MPAARIGASWRVGSWSDTAWEALSWGEPPPVVLRVSGLRLVRGASMRLFVKDPAADNDPYGREWSTELAALSPYADIATSVWSISGGPDEISTLEVASDVVLPDDQITQVYLTGGTLGGLYTVTNTITTNTTPVVTDERSFRVLVQHQ